MFLTRIRPWFLASALAVGAVLVGPTANAQISVDQARTLFQEALALVAAGDYSNALVKLQQVATYRRTPQVTYYIGLCQEKMGKLMIALGEYRIALADAHAANATDVVTEATAAIERVEPRIPKLTVTRGDGAHTAAIAVDGTTIGTLAVGKPMSLDPGTHVLTAQARGFRPFRREITLAEGDSASFEVTMIPSPPEVSSSPSTEPTGTTAQAQADTSSTVSDSSVLPVLAWVSTGIGVAAGAASGYFFYKRNQAISDMDKACNNDRDKCPPDAKSIYDRGRRHTLMGNISVGVGVAGVATGVVLFLVSANSGSNKTSASTSNLPVSVNVVTAAGQQQGWTGLELGGRF